jgi:hypothetical protein
MARCSVCGANIPSLARPFSAVPSDLTAKILQMVAQQLRRPPWTRISAKRRSRSGSAVPVTVVLVWLRTVLVVISPYRVAGFTLQRLLHDQPRRRHASGDRYRWQEGIGCGANGPACCGTRQNSRTWTSRWVTSSNARAGSTDARRGLPVIWGEVSIEAQRVRSREMVAPIDATDRTSPRSCRRIPKIRPVQLRTSSPLGASQKLDRFS